MPENLFNWIVDTLARSEVLDLDFIVSDLFDIPISDAERTESAFYDAMATEAAERVDRNGNIPIGKQVF